MSFVPKKKTLHSSGGKSRRVVLKFLSLYVPFPCMREVMEILKRSQRPEIIIFPQQLGT